MRDSHGPQRLDSVMLPYDLNLLVILMMYWVGVYILVVVGVAIPFILLYIAAGAVWLGFQTMRFVTDTLKRALTVLSDEILAEESFMDFTRDLFVGRGDDANV
jgi:pilus assembly protein TadC